MQLLLWLLLSRNRSTSPQHPRPFQSCLSSPASTTWFFQPRSLICWKVPFLPHVWYLQANLQQQQYLLPLILRSITASKDKRRGRAGRTRLLTNTLCTGVCFFSKASICCWLSPHSQQALCLYLTPIRSNYFIFSNCFYFLLPKKSTLAFFPLSMISALFFFSIIFLMPVVYLAAYNVRIQEQSLYIKWTYREQYQLSSPCRWARLCFAVLSRWAAHTNAFNPPVVIRTKKKTPWFKVFKMWGSR